MKKVGIAIFAVLSLVCIAYGILAHDIQRMLVGFLCFSLCAFLFVALDRKRIKMRTFLRAILFPANPRLKMAVAIIPFLIAGIGLVTFIWQHDVVGMVIGFPSLIIALLWIHLKDDNDRRRDTDEVPDPVSPTGDAVERWLRSLVSTKLP